MVVNHVDDTGVNLNLFSIPQTGLIRTASQDINGMLLVATAAGSGLRFATGGFAFGNERLRIDGVGDLLFLPDNANDLGASGANRPNSIFVGTLLQIEANNGLKLTNQINGAGALGATLTNSPVAGNPTIWVPITVNGANLHFPCW